MIFEFFALCVSKFVFQACKASHPHWSGLSQLSRHVEISLDIVIEVFFVAALTNRSVDWPGGGRAAEVVLLHSEDIRVRVGQVSDSRQTERRQE